MEFRITHRDTASRARAGTFLTGRGSVDTPVFMPVATRGAIRALSIRDIEEIGFDIILSNTYHLYIRPGLDLLKKTGGIHNFLNYHRPILTDSGGFQVFSLSDLCKIHDNGVEFKSHLDGSRHFFSPEKVLEIQRVIGSDIMMVLDQCTHYPTTEEEAKKAVDRTLCWAGISHSFWKNSFDTDKQALFGIIQGSVYRNLREECAEKLKEYDFPGYAIGGLSVGEPGELYMEMTEYTLGHIPDAKPRYMMGVGSPVEILFAIKHGVDMFDCVMPTRIARNGTLYTSAGRVNIKASRYTEDLSPLDENCGCYVCRKFSKAYLRHIYRAGEISSLIYNTYHNLFFMKSFLNDIRESIKTGCFTETYRRWENIYSNKNNKAEE